MEYWISTNGEKDGPYSLEQLQNKTIPPNTLVWHEGLENWVPARELPEFANLYSQTPPPYHAISTPTEQVKCPPTYLVWAILSTLCCCQILGIVAIIYASNVRSKFFRGDFDGAKKSSEKAALWVILAFTIGLATLPIQMALSLL